MSVTDRECYAIVVVIFRACGMPTREIKTGYGNFEGNLPCHLFYMTMLHSPVQPRCYS